MPDPASLTNTGSGRGWVCLAAAAVLVLASACSNDGSGHSRHEAEPGAHGQGHEGAVSNGLLSSEGGYTLVPRSAGLTVGQQTVRFQVQDTAGKAVTTYVRDQTKLLHFYLVRGDVTGYLHDHPTLGPDGTWSIAVNIAAPGPHRMYADFVAQDSAGKHHPLVLSTVLTAPGPYRPTSLPAVSPTLTVDGLTVALAGQITAEKSSTLTFQVSSAGQPEKNLEQYLDSFAHLTAIRVGDLAYQHVHPELTARPGQRGGPTLPFTIKLPESGAWRLFLQVQRAGKLHLVPFTVSAR